MVAVPTGVLAHQGGWDEMLMVAVPLGLFAWLLYLANRRADRQSAGHELTESNDPAEPTDDRPDRSGPITPG